MAASGAWASAPEMAAMVTWERTSEAWAEAALAMAASAAVATATVATVAVATATVVTAAAATGLVVGSEAGESCTEEAAVAAEDEACSVVGAAWAGLVRAVTGT